MQIWLSLLVRDAVLARLRAVDVVPALPGEELAALHADGEVEILFVRAEVLGHPERQESVQRHLLGVDLPDHVRRPPALRPEAVDYPLLEDLVQPVAMTPEALTVREDMMLREQLRELIELGELIRLAPLLGLDGRGVRLPRHL